MAAHTLPAPSAQGNSISRRKLLGAAVTVALLAPVAGTVGAQAVEQDPDAALYGMIRRHAELWAEMSVGVHTDAAGDIGAGPYEECVALERAIGETVATTLGGVLAQVEFLERREQVSLVTDAEEALIASVAEALRRMIARGPS